MLLKLFTKIFGTKSERDLKWLWPHVEQINHAYDQLKDLSNDALRNESMQMQLYARGELRPVVDEIDDIEKDVDQDESITGLSSPLAYNCSCNDSCRKASLLKSLSWA
ncbi:MAG: hypothetical protein AAFP88_03180 [Bacteroidota bacterium]